MMKTQVIKKAFICVILITAMMISGCSLNAAASSTPSVGGLIISEVVTSNSVSLADPVLGTPDWIEICNTSDKPVSLLDYVISESTKNTFAFPDVVLDPGAYLIVYGCVLPDGVSPQAMCTGFKLTREGLTLSLTSPGGDVQKLEVPALETDVSYGIAADGTFKYFPMPTPGSANTTDAFATMNEFESITVPLLINEVLPKDISDTEPYSWVEIYNAGDADIELSNYYITDNMSNPTKAQLPEKLLSAGEYALVKCTGQAGADEVPFKIGDEETAVTLVSSQGRIISALTWEASILPGISAGRGEDGKSVYYTAPSPGAPNSSNFLTNTAVTAGIGDVQITEILLDNTYSVIDADGERSAWVELCNTSAAAVRLSDYALSDNADSLWKWSLPDTELAPGAYILVYLSGKDRKTGDELHTNFKIASAETKIYLTNLSLGKSQTLELAAERKDNVSYGLSPDGTWLYYPQPSPLAPNDNSGFTEIAAVAGSGSAGLCINEVMAVNTAKDGKPDWVEIYNEQSADVDLTGYFLSDTIDNLQKWPISGVTVGAGGYALVDAYQQTDDTDELKIALSGETLYLSNPQGLVLDLFDTGVMRPGVSRGLSANGDTESTALFQTPTPGAANAGDIISGYCAAPVFSVSGGYQTAPVILEMSTPTQGAAIYYTLDGSTPSAGSALYAGPITLSATQTVRAVTILGGMLDSDQTVATYLFENTHSLPVICLSMTQSDLTFVFGSADRRNERERAGYVEYYEADGSLGVSFPAGFRIAGAGTRLYPQRSINLYLREGYGRSSVVYPFFDDYEITEFKGLSLRNMGQDRPYTCIRDAFFQMAVNGMTIENMQSKFAAVYINGAYWGLYEFKENQNSDSFASKYGIDPDDVEMVRANTYAFKGDSRNIKELFSDARGNTNDPENFASFTERADAAYFMDYLIAQTYFCNSDAYNQKYAHTTDNVMKWRPMFYDLDWGFMGNNPKRSIIGNFFSASGISLGVDEDGTSSSVDTGLFYGFYKNEEWRAQFVARYAEVLNTILTDENLLSRFDAMVASVADEMPRHIARWGTPSSVSKWEGEVASLRECIAARRPYAIDSLQSFFNISDEEIAALFPNG